MITLIFLSPLVLCIILTLFRNILVNRVVVLLYTLCFTFTAFIMCTGRTFFFLEESIVSFFTFDPLSKLFIAVLACVNAGVVLYMFSYFKLKPQTNNLDTLFSAFYLLFIASIAGVILSAHLGLSWIFIEATTLTGAVLIYSGKERTTLEAVWKYIFICSIGVSLSFIGIILLAMSGVKGQSLFFADLYIQASRFNPFLLKLSFAFILVGFGTKMGLAPIHAWLPDVHSEAPAPVSSLLSGVLLNAAAIIIIRFNILMDRAGLLSFSSVLIIIMGVLSLVVSASFIALSVNYKRMLAYSSIENMGILAICIGIGKTALFAGLLQMIVHSLAKSGLFLTSGNIHLLYNTKRISDVRGLLKKSWLNSCLWICGFVALCGLPPFGGFMSKLLFAESLIGNGYIILFIPVFLLLIIIIAGIFNASMSMSFGDSGAEPVPAASTSTGSINIQKEAAFSRLSGPLFYIPQLLFLVLLLLLGFLIPQPVKLLIDNASDYIRSGGFIR